MQYTKILAAVLLAASGVLAKTEPKVVAPAENAVVQAGGGDYTIAWENLPGDKVNVALYSGPNQGLEKVEDIATDKQNGGSFLWKPQEFLNKGDNYVIGITAGDKTIYSPYFSIQMCSTCTHVPRKSSLDKPKTISVDSEVIGKRTDAPAGATTTPATSATATPSAKVTGTASSKPQTTFHTITATGSNLNSTKNGTSSNSNSTNNGKADKSGNNKGKTDKSAASMSFKFSMAGALIGAIAAGSMLLA